VYRLYYLVLRRSFYKIIIISMNSTSDLFHNFFLSPSIIFDFLPVIIFVFIFVLLVPIIYWGIRDGKDGVNRYFLTLISNTFLGLSSVFLVLTFYFLSTNSFSSLLLFFRISQVCIFLLILVYLHSSIKRGKIISIAKYDPKGWVYKIDDPVRFKITVFLWVILACAYLVSLFFSVISSSVNIPTSTTINSSEYLLQQKYAQYKNHSMDNLTSSEICGAGCAHLGGFDEFKSCVQTAQCDLTN